MNRNNEIDRSEELSERMDEIAQGEREEKLYCSVCDCRIWERCYDIDGEIFCDETCLAEVYLRYV